MKPCIYISMVQKIHQIMQYHGSYKLGARAQNAEGETNLNPDINKIQQHTNWYPDNFI